LASKHDGRLSGLLVLHQGVVRTDFTEDLPKINVPMLIMHGEDDQIVPVADSAILAAKMVKGAVLRVVPGAPHGMCTTHKDLVNKELLAFIRS
jgi:non-heme chloroperoxidase